MSDMEKNNEKEKKRVRKTRQIHQKYECKEKETLCKKAANNYKENHKSKILEVSYENHCEE